MSLKPIWLIGLMVLALCTATASAQDSSLRVVGIGSVQVPTDTVIIAVISHNSSDNASLAGAVNSEILNNTEESLIAAGVKKEEIMPNRSKGYITYHKMVCNTINNTTSCKDVVENVATERFIIKLRTSDENQTQKVIEAAESKGADATVLGYTLSDSSKAVDQAREKALGDAKARAEDLSSSFGFSLGKAMEIEEPRYPDIEIGPTYGWNAPWKMNYDFWMKPFDRMERMFSDDYVPEKMAKVTAYVKVTYTL